MISTRLVAVCLTSAICSWAASPWVPESGKASLITLYVNDSFQDYRPGGHVARLPSPYEQFTYYTIFEYGLGRNLALDVESGHTETNYLGKGLSGITDTTIGMRWRAKAGERWALTLRGAAIVKGNYQITQTANFSPGDKASGGLGSVLFGSTLKYGFFTYTEAGYRIRQGPVPQDFFGNAGIGNSWKGITLSTTYQTARSINGVDIGTPTFKPPLFPATKKIFGAMDYGVNYRFRNGLSFGFDYSTIYHGRNVGLKRVFAASVGFTIPGRGPHIR
jgi:hypothetical protein